MPGCAPGGGWSPALIKRLPTFAYPASPGMATEAMVAVATDKAAATEADNGWRRRARSVRVGGGSGMICIGRRSVRMAVPADECEHLRSHFARARCLQLPGLLDQDLLESLQRRIAAAPFAPREVHHIGFQEVAADPGLNAMAFLILNRDPLFRFLQEVTGLQPVRGFAGQVYRLEPNSGQQLDWHDDRLEP